MKKLTLLLLTLILALFVACNSDAESGIYSNVADSRESSNVNIFGGYLGNVGSEYYYLSDEGIVAYKQDNKVIYGHTNDYLIRGASINDSNNLLVLRKIRKTLKNELWLYSNPTSNSATNITPTGVEINSLLRCGLFYSANAVYRYNTSSSLVELVQDFDPTNIGNTVFYTREAENYALFCVKQANGSYKYYIIKNDGTVDVTTNNATLTHFVVFQPTSTGNYSLVAYDKGNAIFRGYKATSGDTKFDNDNWEMKSYLSKNYSAQAASFYDSSTNSLYIKASSYFDKVNLSNTNKEVSVERNDIRTLDIINITSCGSYYVAATHQSLCEG
ncbi:MAG: hypothetical protein HUK23_07615 [Sphaerochaetaceae bacterium]|nr:hypothetical protein [Sphaerochaetaceae bacterium]